MHFAQRLLLIRPAVMRVPVAGVLVLCLARVLLALQPQSLFKCLRDTGDSRRTQMLDRLADVTNPSFAFRAVGMFALLPQLLSEFSRLEFQLLGHLPRLAFQLLCNLSSLAFQLLSDLFCLAFQLFRFLSPALVHQSLNFLAKLVEMPFDYCTVISRCFSNSSDLFGVPTLDFGMFPRCKRPLLSQAFCFRTLVGLRLKASLCRSRVVLSGVCVAAFRSARSRLAFPACRFATVILGIGGIGTNDAMGSNH